MARLEARGLVRAYDDFRVGPLSLAFDAGSLCVLLGPSGSGKTTLLRILAGLEPPDQGEILLDGRDVTRLPAEARGVGLVFQDGALFPHLDVQENVAFGLRVQKMPRDARQGRVREVLSLVDMEEKAHRRIARLSGGERQRVALARALAPAPRVLLLDEPLASLDRALREELRGVLREIHDRLHLTTILVTHDRDEALALADRLVLLEDGRLVEEGPPRDLFHAPRTAFAARFLGTANVVETKEGPVAVPLDAIRFEEGAPDATVVARRFLGFHDELRLQRDDGTFLEARRPPGEDTPPGTRVRVAWDPARVRRLEAGNHRR